MELTQRFRRHVAPYDVVTSLKFVAGTNYCPAVQTLDGAGQFNIDRTSTPTIIVADVVATSKDNSGSVDGVISSQVTNIKWMVQKGSEATGRDITTHPDWSSSDFSINNTGADKGRLTVTKNVDAGTTWKVWMECDIYDTRRGYGVTIHVITESVLLFSIGSAEDQYTMSIDRPSAEVYEPAIDRQLIHNFIVANGDPDLNTSLVETRWSAVASGAGTPTSIPANWHSTPTEADVARATRVSSNGTWSEWRVTPIDDGNTFRREMHIQLKKGGVLQTAGTDYTIKVFTMNGSNRTEVTAATEDSLEYVTGNTIVFDTRFAESATFQIACFVGSKEVGHKTYGWVWSSEMPTSDEGIVGGATYNDGNEQTYKPKLNIACSVLEYPTIAYALDWYYRKNGLLTFVGSGETQSYDLTNGNMFAAGSGEGEAVCQVNKKGAFYYLTDESGNRLVDENGDYLIDNQ